ncbi:hypothetical protein L1049_011054 [Liquidambar formosana]|uniref:Uncharacterized protein n=1 Tax=Liquidambar formosana TaxID=63359 RepID=A0AAP0RQX0_LIQFO
MTKLANPESQEAELQKLHSARKDLGLISGKHWKLTLKTRGRLQRLYYIRFMAMCLGLEAMEFSEGFQQGKCEVRMNC